MVGLGVQYTSTEEAIQSKTASLDYYLDNERDLESQDVILLLLKLFFLDLLLHCLGMLILDCGELFMKLSGKFQSLHNFSIFFHCCPLIFIQFFPLLFLFLVQI